MGQRTWSLIVTGHRTDPGRIRDLHLNRLPGWKQDYERRNMRAVAIRAVVSEGLCVGVSEKQGLYLDRQSGSLGQMLRSLR